MLGRMRTPTIRQLQIWPAGLCGFAAFLAMLGLALTAFGPDGATKSVWLIVVAVAGVVLSSTIVLVAATRTLNGGESPLHPDTRAPEPLKNQARRTWRIGGWLLLAVLVGLWIWLSRSVEILPLSLVGLVAVQGPVAMLMFAGRIPPATP